MGAPATSRRSETKRRQLVVTSWELVEAATNVADDAAEVGAVVEHVLRTRASVVLDVAGRLGLAHPGGSPRELLHHVVDRDQWL